MWDIDATTTLLQQVSNTADPREVLRIFLEHAHQSFSVQRALVLSRERLNYPLVRVLLSARAGDSRAGAVVDKPDIVQDGGLLANLLYAGRFRRMMPLEVDNAEPAHELLEGFRSLVAFPLFDRGDAVGMVVLLGPTEQDCTAAELCALAVMGALLQRSDRAHALTEQLENACRALDTELAAAASVQRWLPPPPGPPVAGVRTAALYQTAQHAGGDYYDTGQLPDGSFGVFVADVSGHGAAAAVLMAILRTIVHDEVDQSRVVGPAALLDRADARLCTLGLSSRGAFVTAFSAALDTATGELCYSCAGHPPPRLVRARNKTIQSLEEAHSLPLGVLDERPARPQESVVLAPNDIAVFYSDGITEARSPDGEFFGIEALDCALRKLPSPTTPEAVIAAIEEAVKSFAGGNPPFDDQTILAVQWTGNSAKGP